MSTRVTSEPPSDPGRPGTPATPGFLTELADTVGSLPPVAARVIALASDPDCSLDELHRIIRADGALAMRFLALANSAAFARGDEVRDLQVAVVRLGLRRVRNVAICLGMHDLCPSAADESPLDRRALWRSSLTVASCAQLLARRATGSPSPEDAFLGGMLQGIGPLVLARRGGQRFAGAVLAARHEGWSLSRAERTLFGFDHDELTARVLERWNLPAVFGQAIAAGQVPAEASPHGDEAATLASCLRSARSLARALGCDCGDGDPDPELVDTLGSAGIPESEGEVFVQQVADEVASIAQLIGLDGEGPTDLSTELVQRSREVARVGLEGCDATLVREELDRELAVARDIQQRLLPIELPRLPGIQLAAESRPSRVVSGDTYDVLLRPDGSLLLAIADVAGKGLPAALLASNLQATVRALAARPGRPSALLAAANGALDSSTEPEVFATLFLAELDPASRFLRFAGAGHTPPLLQRASGDSLWLEPAGPPLALLPNVEFEDGELELATGDALVLYTDGVTEAADTAGRLLRPAGLARAVREAGPVAAPDLVAAVRRAVKGHIAGGKGPAGKDGLPATTVDFLVGSGPIADAAPEDDATVLIMRLADESAPAIG